MPYDFGEFALDVDARQLYRGDEPVHLSPKAFDLLEFLVAQRPRAISKQTLYDHLWPDTLVVEANLPILIREIRVAIGDNERRIIRTVQRHGYAFAGQTRQRRSASAHALMQGAHELPLHEGENLVGRGPAAAVPIRSASVSRRHALITVTGDRATIVDLKSKNGTRVNDAPLAGSRTLTDGNLVAFGTIEMIYRWCLADAPTDTAAPG